MEQLTLIQSLNSRFQSLLHSKFIRDTITLQIGKLAFIGINVAGNVVLTRGLGAEDYGIYALTLSLYSLFMVFNIAGLDASTVTRLSESIATHNRIVTRNLMGFFLQVSLAVAIIFTAAAWLFAPTIAVLTQDNATIGELYDEPRKRDHRLKWIGIESK